MGLWEKERLRGREEREPVDCRVVVCVCVSGKGGVGGK